MDRIMRRLQKRKGLNEVPKLCHYFDLIAGTSTGGLIAILLGQFRMTTAEALETYDKVAGDIFCRSNFQSQHVEACRGDDSLTAQRG